MGVTDQGKPTQGQPRPDIRPRWKKGQSGNPNGRWRKKPNKEAILNEILSEKIILREEGKERKVTKFETLYPRRDVPSVARNMLRLLRSFDTLPRRPGLGWHPGATL
jgi:hypothetical protein